MKPKESENQKAIRELLEWKGWKVIRLNTGAFPIYDKKTGRTRYMRTGAKGLPDLLALKETYPPLFLEIKRSGGKVSADQENMINLINQTTARATVLWSVDELVDYLAGLDEEMGDTI